jgi:NAD(P)-dependent dehydrogenase (short-subunit alcohol dehydrogenase family)
LTRPLEGRAAIVTGASRGLGLEIARAYARAGASVLLCARDANVLEQARATVSAETPEAVVAVEAGDVSKPTDVARVVGLALERFSQVHVVVSNAGVYGPMGRFEDVTWDEWTETIEINLFGSALMARAILPHFRRFGYGKIVQLSGGGATAPMPGSSAYAASKAAVVRLMETLAVETLGTGIDVNAVAPGAVNTRMLDEVLEAGLERVGQERYERAIEQRESGGVPPELAAGLAVFLGSAASDGITGRLISAVWDPWESLAECRDELAAGDVYTLRRIVPRDRGLSWERPHPAS